jgi:hypothetical protein
MPERRGTGCRAGARLVEERGARPRFLWLHLYDPHAPYEPRTSLAHRAAPYLGEVAAADAFWRRCSTLCRPASALLAVTARRRGAGRHGEMTHRLFAYGRHSKFRCCSGSRRTGRTGRPPARHVDIFPTLLEAAGVAPPAPPTPSGRADRCSPARQRVETYFELSTMFTAAGRRCTSGGRSQGIACRYPALRLARDRRGENLIDRARRRALSRACRSNPSRAARAGGGAGELRSLGYRRWRRPGEVRPPTTPRTWWLSRHAASDDRSPRAAQFTVRYAWPRKSSLIGRRCRSVTPCWPRRCSRRGHAAKRSRSCSRRSAPALPPTPSPCSSG